MRLPVLALPFTLATCSPSEELKHDKSVVVLKGATVVDGTGATPRRDAVIVLQNDRILRVGNADDEDYPANSLVRDLNGRYIVPGFIDTHVHPRPDAKTQGATLQTLLAFGITTLRNPSARPGAGVQLRDRVNAGDLLAPCMFTAGPLIDAPPPSGQRSSPWAYVETEEEIRAEVRRQQEAGVDFIKLYRRLEPNLVAAAIDESHKVGLSVIGHMGATSWFEAANAGIDVLVHSGPDKGLLPPFLRDQSGQPTPGDYLRHWRSSIDFDGADLEALVSALIANGVEVNPTLVYTEAKWWGDDLGVLERMEPELAPASDIPGGWGENWRKCHPSTCQWTAQDFLEAKATFPFVLRFFRVLYDRGVFMTAGTDVGNPWMTPGVSFHRELEILVQAGIPPGEVLTIATRNGAIALGILDDVGTIEPGKRADLVILERDPLADIRNTQSIISVIHNGVSHDPRELLRD